MRIIKRGVLPAHKFTCRTCGAVFETDSDEYQKEKLWTNMTNNNGTIITHHVFQYRAICPICNGEVFDQETIEI